MKGRGRSSALGWALLLSLAVHVLSAPFFGLKALAREKPEAPERSTISYVRHVIPTPPPPPPATPTPAPRRSPSPPPARQAARPQHRAHRRIAMQPVKLAHDPTADGSPAATTMGSQTVGAPYPGDLAGSPAPPETSAPRAAATDIAPPTETPKPMCAKPDADAAVKGPPIEPDFPQSARDRGEAGTAEVRVTLAASGAVIDVAVERSSGFAALDREALRAARSSSYSAQIVDCAPTPGQYLFTADFDGR